MNKKSIHWLMALAFVYTLIIVVIIQDWVIKKIGFGPGFTVLELPLVVSVFISLIGCGLILKSMNKKKINPPMTPKPSKGII